MKHEIEIPDFPEGYEIGKPKVVYAHMGDNNPVISIPLKKKQPRRIVLEETEVCEYPTKGDWYFYRGELRKWNQYNTCDHQHKLWKIVEDNK